MRFNISRTSMMGTDSKPCPEAIPVIVDRGIPELNSVRYEIELNSIEELAAFASKYSSCIISPKVLVYPRDGVPNYSIEIYDDWRE